MNESIHPINKERELKMIILNYQQENSWEKAGLAWITSLKNTM